MPKFHVNIQGDAGVCRARKNCPYGDLATDHYPTAEVARRAYELENEEQLVRLPDEVKQVLMEIGPRQLPNRMWITLRNAIYDRSFSPYTLNHAVVTISEEWNKLSALTEKRLQLWGQEERNAATGLARLGKSAAYLTAMADDMQASKIETLHREFPSDFPREA